ncbi:MAG TPA: SpoIID/LytB domain-containing protein [Actinomycetota bacterium]|nr:SpoIID/LytB domain-containing protein [Actinomycetota bacterium]
MRAARRLSVLVASLVVLGVACTSTEPPVPSRQQTTPPPEASGTAASPSETAPQLDEVTLEAPLDASFLVVGRYPHVGSRCVGAEQPRLRARYPGTLQVERSDEGTLALTVALPFDEYLKGIAEMPASWPMAALEAQAIAARSYALATTGWQGEEGDPLEEPICATTACQVYGGIPLERSPDTRRWYRAVRWTDGQVIVFDGRPAQTVYFSTSNGHTYGNEDVFGSDPLPYLRPVVERDDGASPLSHWTTDLRFADLARFLAEAGEWAGHRRISDVRLKGGTVRVSGEGRTRAMDLGTFRDAVNTYAHCLIPSRYPEHGMPTTIPSRWLSMQGGRHSVTVKGRGWGHGAGMVQWGAYGKARRGLSADQILAFYYGGFRPEPFPEPGQIRVEVASGLTVLRVRPSEPGALLNGEALPRGRVVISGGDTITVEPPS